jgi:dTDP-4-dehydrorhamnose reductase
MATLIVFGASGLLGAHLVPALESLGHNVLTQRRSGGGDLCFDPADRTAVFQALLAHKPSAVINLIGATNVDQCETQPRLAWSANVSVVKILADSLTAYGEVFGVSPHLVHISTDQVYDGHGPHAEEDINLINVYALSKYTGELLAERVGATILRTNFYGRSRCVGRISFSDWLVRSMKHRTSITLFDDVIFSAIHMETLSNIIARCVERRPVGVYNAGCRDSISKARFALALAEKLDLPTDKVTLGRSSEAVLRARRPVDMSLQVSSLENALGIQLPTILTEIDHTAKDYLNE